MVSSLSTESFLQSLRRFISRRGRPCTIYSDNGTNFIGTANLWKNVDWERIRKSEYGSSHVIQPITWVFNPPSAPWWGGWWERIVRILKQVLRKVLGRACLDFEEMMTVLCDSEAVVNSRPLTYISDDIDDFIPLTPSMFLQEIREVGIPDMDSIDAETLNKRVKYRQKVRQHFRVRFRSEYLGMLMPIKKIRGVDEAIKPGDVVLVGSDNSKRVNWPMARVLEVFPGKDGVIRVAKVKTLTGEIVRPIQRLYPFEVSKEEREILVAEPEVDKELPSGLESDDVTPPVKMSRFGRKIKPPKRIC
ncbi:unnamed protein product [Allacma fusca]|uniref:Integrase catalytic domain-containing protein n=1 Tax=Allacma fusca TaxID=39272 RepID=A0A8J2P6Q7_9HEXA|nr:unnamed protein product [Allacma fusca]